VEEFITYILIVIAWHPDHPGKFEIAKRHVVASEAECKTQGTDAIERSNIYKLEFGGASFEYLCIESASTDEIEELWGEKMEKLEAERLEREKEAQK
jgi:hypothetical protein